jgi:LPS-assembly protein
MRPRNLVFITLLVLCHLQVGGQALTNALPGGQKSSAGEESSATPAGQALPDDPGQELVPLAQPEPTPPTGVPIQFEALRQDRVGDTLTLTGDVVIRYHNYILCADKVVYHQSTSELEADGHLQLTGGPDDVLINATHGDMRLNMNTARFYNVSGSEGVRKVGRTTVYSTPNPLLFSGRVLLELGKGEYRVIDGTMTNCHLPKPDWQIISHAINIANGEASASNSWFKFLHMPVFFLPYLRHSVEVNGRESGLLIPELSNSSIKGFIVGEEVYWVINRSMDMVVGSEYYSKRGWAPNGDFRYKGVGLNHLTARWNALLDRGIQQEVGNTLTTPAAGVAAGAAKLSSRQGSGQNSGLQAGLLPGPVGNELVNQGGVDIIADGRRDLGPETYAAGTAEYLSSYLYRLVFNDNFTAAVSSEVASDVGLTHAHNAYIPSLSLDRFETFANTTSGNEARFLHLPSVRYDVLDQPLGTSPFYWGMGSSAAYLSRSEPHFHARNVGRLDLYPHLSMPFQAGGWSVVPEAALRDTVYTISQDPDTNSSSLTLESRGDTPFISHEPLNRADGEVSVDLRAPAVERDFVLGHGSRVLRHVIEPEFTYRYVGGIGSQAQHVLLIDTTDIATNTDELEYSLMQRFYLSPGKARPCDQVDETAGGECPAQPREWASWQLAQKFFFNPTFGGAVIPDRRNVFDTTLDFSGVDFLSGPRNLSPIISRVRFEAIPKLRAEWDLDYDPKAGQLNADNLYAGYSWGRTTAGVGHSMLNAVDENGTAASTIKSQQLQPFLYIGKQTGSGFNLAANTGYDFVLNQLQYMGVQAVYNWNCCGLTFGYRRFLLGSVRDETQFLYSFTLASFGSAGDIRRATSVFRDPSLPPAY